MKNIFKTKSDKQDLSTTKCQVEIDAKKYEETFFKRGKVNVREGKAIYIRPDFHKTITRIVQTVGDGKVSLTDYVDNVFAHHFRHYEQEIRESFNKNNKPIL